jgi:acyl-CoA reductase-like NAD-dependent aldehyde dehydrogenase
MLKDGKFLKDRCYVAGEWIGGAAIVPITNPVDDSVIGHVPKLGATETRNAIEAAASMAVAREECPTSAPLRQREVFQVGRISGSS